MAKTKDEEPLSNLRRPPVPAANQNLEHRLLGGESAPATRKQRAEPKVVVTFQLELSLDEELESRAQVLGLKKRDIITRGIRMALDSKEFQQ